MCIKDIVEDGSDLLTVVLHTDQQTLELTLTEEERELASIEGWEAVADIDPALFREGAIDKWRELRLLPTNH
jgi:hypothetical protein